jgi:AsmA protein
VVPTVLGNGSDGGLSVPVLITGPWASPSFRPDLEFLAKQRFDVEAEAIEDRARQALDDKIADELNVAPTEGQSVEDAVKDKLEDELKGALGGLFGRN